MIQPTKHAIQEYLNDNPNAKDPAKYLVYCLIWMKKAKAKEWIDYNTKTSLIRYKDEAIVYNGDTIITYYRIIHRHILNIKQRTKTKVNSVLSGRMERIKQEKAYRKLNKQYKKTSYNDVFKKFK